MRVTNDQLILNEALALQWGSIKTLKVLEKKLLVVLDGGISVELTGLDPKTVDAAFAAYSRYLNQH